MLDMYPVKGRLGGAVAVESAQGTQGRVVERAFAAERELDAERFRAEVRRPCDVLRFKEPSP
jgi:hypothetical protein